MQTTFETVRALSIASFLIFGIACLVSKHMVLEFERYGLSRFRRLTGSLEVLGALGLLGSYLYPPVAALAAGGLAVMMLLGVLTRIRIRDSLLATLPAVVLLASNLFLAAYGAGLLAVPASTSPG